MASTPFIQIYPGDYLADTQHFTTEQHGAYLLILMAMWMHGGTLPNDHKKLALVARLSARRWRLCREEIMEKLTVENDRVTQKRLQQEYQKRVSKSEFRRLAGSLGGRAKSLKNNKPPLANGVAKSKHSPEAIYKHTLDADAREWPVLTDDEAEACCIAEFELCRLVPGYGVQRLQKWGRAA